MRCTCMCRTSLVQTSLLRQKLWAFIIFKLRFFQENKKAPPQKKCVLCSYLICKTNIFYKILRFEPSSEKAKNCNFRGFLALKLVTKSYKMKIM